MGARARCRGSAGLSTTGTGRLGSGSCTCAVWANRGTRVEIRGRSEGEDEMVETAGVGTLEQPGYVEFLTTGDPAVGEFHCGECSYGVVVSRELPRCPMCGGNS